MRKGEIMSEVNNSSKRISRKVLMRNLRFMRMAFIFGFIMLVVGVIFVATAVFNCYPKGDKKRFDMTVVSSREQTDVEEQKDAVVAVVKYHLVGDINYNNEEHMVVLNEAYSSQAQANSKIGETRSVMVNLENFTEMTKKPFNWIYVIQCIMGVMIMIVTFLYLYRYNNVVSTKVTRLHISGKAVMVSNLCSQKSNQAQNKSRKSVESSSDDESDEEDAYIDALIDRVDAKNTDGE